MTAMVHHPHRVASAVADARASLASVAGVPVWSMDAGETTATLADIVAAKAQLAELEARLLAHADRADIPARTGATRTAAWFAHQTKTTHAAARRAMRLADGLEAHEQTQAALAEGRLHEDQALVILEALAQLPDGLDPDLVTKAEAHLIAEAAHHDAKALRVLGRRLLEVIDPEAADAHEAALLEREERDAQAAARLVMWDDGHGRVHGKFTIPTLEGAMLKKALLALAAPKHRASQGPLGEQKPTPERLGQAFCEYVARYPRKKLPKTGGINATVVATVTLESLMDGLKAAHLDTGQTISAALARKLACEAGIIPAVLGGKSEVLDLGRSKRFASEHQRIAKIVETGGQCETDGCDQPGAHLHHRTRWADGGQTDLKDLIGLCPRHHTHAHDPTFTMTKLPTGTYTFHRRT